MARYTIDVNISGKWLHKPNGQFGATRPMGDEVVVKDKKKPIKKKKKIVK